MYANMHEKHTECAVYALEHAVVYTICIYAKQNM